MQQVASAQCTLKLNGHITDRDTREHLQNAGIRIKELNKTVLSNAKGEYSFAGLCPGTYTLIVSHVSCSTIELHIHLKEDLEKDFEMEHYASQLSEVVVTGTISEKNVTPSSQLKGKSLEATRGLTLGESLKRIAGVSVLQTGSNIYKPVIHGLHGNRVLILNNGVRQEGQQWGGEHAPEIDTYIANRISVIKGASAIRYGGDAIAGVILVEPKRLRLAPGIGGEMNVALFSNNRQGTVSGILEGNSAKHPSFSWRAQGTYKRGGFARTPNYWLANSSNEEYNFSVTAGWKKEASRYEIFYSQFNNRLGIFSGAHIGNLTDLLNAISSKEPPDYIRNVGFSYAIERPYQDIQHHLLKLKSYRNTGKIGRINFSVSGQYNNRKEFDQKRFQTSSNLPQLNLSIGTGIAEVVWDHYNTGKWRGTVGGSFMYQNNRYESRLFIPNYESTNAGLFWIEKWTHLKWVLEGGVRVDSRSIFNTFDNNDLRTYPDKLFTNLSGNIGFNYKVMSGFKLVGNISRAWRGPHANELYSNGLHHGTARIVKGDPNLTHERSNTFSANVIFNRNGWDIDAGAYLKNIDGFIFLEPTFPPELTIRGAFPAFRFTQTNAQLTGIDFSANYSFNPHIAASAKASVLRARNKKTNDWLIQMPPDRYELEAAYYLGNARKLNESYFKIHIAAVLRQTRFPATGNVELKHPDGTVEMVADYAFPAAGYTLLGFEAGTKLKVGHNNWSFILSATNLTNVVYRDYMNAFRYFSDEMGRNIALRIRIPFDIKHKHKS